MGEHPKSPDDETWTEEEQSFFAAAPPEEPEPVGEPPSFDDLAAVPPQRSRTEIIARLRSALAGTGREATLVLGATVGRVNRRRAVFALMGAIVAAGLTAGGVALRRGGLTNSVPMAAGAAPVATSASTAPPRPNVGPSADVQAPRAVASNRRPHEHRKSVPAFSSAPRPPVTAFMDRETYWASEQRSAPVRSSKPLFSR